MPYNIMFEVLTGIALVFSGLFALYRQYLLEPDSGEYPKAPTWLRLCMFAFATVQILIGLQTFSTARPVADPMTLLAVMLLIYNGAMLGNVLRQRYPEEVWLKLNKINDRLFCSKSDLRKWLIK